jgi:hypothetical protein
MKKVLREVLVNIALLASVAFAGTTHYLACHRGGARMPHLAAAVKAGFEVAYVGVLGVKITLVSLLPRRFLPNMA